ncbi:glycogen synthase [Aliifodinibius sp. S!AR15-10]|uniref:glycogen synthase n=1 Tax=Aliifodinibius sp. S!AR15-10 TaxID=2950437 RepID=UPI00285EF350|nr:glycogen synthase [Aliifodinibius sp. S!AR15-10]MDR8390415.1 glycogen synthase [Aliifodinibius sp. S!AR15-10]
MNIIHLSAECYPVAKAGGLADVVGSLPKYMRNNDVDAKVVMPKYATEWVQEHEFETIFEGDTPLGEGQFHYKIQREKEDSLGFPLYLVDIPERFDRPGIYIDPYSGHGYWDELERYLSFQLASLDWLHYSEEDPDLLHCHDHHTALVPFIITRCYRYRGMENIPTVLTVHNAEYQGEYDREVYSLLPSFNLSEVGLLDWDGKFNCLAAGIKCCWKITTVSPSYMEELSQNGDLSLLYHAERHKSVGILNGIDTEVWNPKTDPYLEKNYTLKTHRKSKLENKEALCDQFDLNPEYPLISYIGRLAREKGADLLPDLFSHFLGSEQSVNFMLLGTGDRGLHERFRQMNSRFVGFFDAALDYNESLAHLIYAASDFIIMPSRVEPCGLNQMYSMRYGTVPIVRKVGGLKDTVKDIGEEDGYGITFYDFTHHAAADAIQRSLSLYEDSKGMNSVRKTIMRLDFSWKTSANKYLELYRELIND